MDTHVNRTAMHAAPLPHPRPWHAGSLFSAGPRCPLSPGQRALWLARLVALRRARRLSPAEELVGRECLRLLGADGRLDPSHETLAGRAGVGERTVRRALRKLAEARLLTWERRLVRRPGAWRAEQTSNAYALLLDGWRAPLPPPARVRLRVRRGAACGCCGGQTGRQDSQPITTRLAERMAELDAHSARLRAITKPIPEAQLARIRAARAALMGR